jgi:REP element-mobilizing transposase RayT
MSGKAFNTGEPLAYFLTWSSYGTWLPGDDRGWNRKDEPDPQPPNSFIVEMAESRMKETEFRLSTSDRDIVEATIRKHCEIRNWPLHAVNPRTNHVHVVVTARGYRPETVRDQFKAWCTRKLKAVHATRTQFWTEGGSRRWINTEDDLAAAVAYVLEAQDERRGEEE